MDLFKRIGTQKRKFKLQFFIGKLKFSSYCQGKIYIVVKRGSHKAKSQQKLQMSQDLKINFNKEILQIQVTLYFDEKQNRYQQKPGQMHIVLLDSKNNKKQIGIVSFDVAEYANSGTQSLKQKRKIQNTPPKLQAAIQFNVFIKYIGEGSQSSLDKIGQFFFGKSTKQPQLQKKLSQSTKKPTIKNQKPFQTQQQKQQSNKKIVNFYQVDQNNNKRESNKIKQLKTFEQDNYEYEKKNKKNNINNFYFDQPKTQLKGDKKNKNKNKLRSNSTQKITQSEYNGRRRQSDELERDSGRQNKQKLNNSNYIHSKQDKIYSSNQLGYKPNLQQTLQTTNVQSSKQYIQLQKKLQYQNQQTQTYKKRHQAAQNIIRQLQTQVTKLKQRNKQLQAQLESCHQDILRKQEEIQTMRRRTPLVQNMDQNSIQFKMQQYRQQIKRLQKQKNQFIVQNSKLKQKYKHDFKKYQQHLLDKNQQQLGSSQANKAQLVKLKQECCNLRLQIQNIKKQKNDKNIQLIKQIKQNNNLKQQVTLSQTKLSKIKIKICNSLNQALVKNEKNTIDLLTELNKQQE